MSRYRRPAAALPAHIRALRAKRYAALWAARRAHPAEINMLAAIAWENHRRIMRYLLARHAPDPLLIDALASVATAALQSPPHA